MPNYLLTTSPPQLHHSFYRTSTTMSCVPVYNKRSFTYLREPFLNKQKMSLIPQDSSRVTLMADDSSEYLLSRSSILSLMMSMKMLMVLMVRAMEDVGSSGSEFSTDMVISVDLPTHVMNLKTTTSSLGTIVYILQPASLVLLSTYYNQLSWCYCPHITISSLGAIVHISQSTLLVLLSPYHNQLSLYFQLTPLTTAETCS